MSPLLNTFTQIALRKRGPDALPASQFLFIAVLLSYVLLHLSLLLFANHDWEVRIGLLVMSPLFLASFALIVLRLEGKQERSMQVLIALFGLSVLFGLLHAPVAIALIQMLPSPESIGADGAIQMSPLIAFLALIELVILIWNIAALGWVFQRALDKDVVYGTGIAVIYYFVDVLLSQSMVS